MRRGREGRLAVRRGNEARQKAAADVSVAIAAGSKVPTATIELMPRSSEPEIGTIVQMPRIMLAAG